jgi:hypothetical protein
MALVTSYYNEVGQFSKQAAGCARHAQLGRTSDCLQLNRLEFERGILGVGGRYSYILFFIAWQNAV